MITVHLKKLRKRVEITAEEEQVIRDSVAEIRRVGADQLVVRSGEELSVSLLLIDGWLARIKDLAGGERHSEPRTGESAGVAMGEDREI